MQAEKHQWPKVKQAICPAKSRLPVACRARHQFDLTHSRWMYVLPGRKDADSIRIGKAAKWLLISQDTLVRATKHGWIPCRANLIGAWRYFTLNDLYGCHFLTFAGAARFFGVRATYLRKLCRYYIRWYSRQHRQQGIRYTYRISLVMACAVLIGQVHKTQIRLRPVPNDMNAHNACRLIKAMNYNRTKAQMVASMKGA